MTEGNVNLTIDARIARNAYTWNTAGGFLSAFESVIILMVVTRVCDMTVAGVFTIAYANANQFMYMGKYGMRNFQASDVNHEYAFSTYARSRAITTAAMVVSGSAYLIFNALTLGYDLEKSFTILVMLLFLAVNTIEDVFAGNCQQHGRLDLGAKGVTIRIAATITLLCIGIAMTGQLLSPLVMTTVFAAVFLVGEVIWWRRLGFPVRVACENPRGLRSLLRACFPLFLATFLLFYIGNAPKYAIDALMTDVEQAYYGFIAMPVFVVTLLAGFAYNPLVKSLADDWTNGNRRCFRRRIGLQVLIVIGLTVACDLAALLAGVPVLGLLYNADFYPYLGDLIVLVTGGGFLALANLLTMGLAVARKQRWLPVGYITVAVLAAVCSPLAVHAGGIDGASWIYLVLMTSLAIWFTVVFLITTRERSEQDKKETSV